LIVVGTAEAGLGVADETHAIGGPALSLRHGDRRA
jgi:hypothetical protein